MTRLNFTKRVLEALPIPTKGKRITYYDTKIPGLAVRVTDTGTKTLIVYRKIDGRPERVTLGTFPASTVEQGRRLAMDVNAAIAKGENPNDRQRATRAEMTLGDLFTLFPTS